MILFNLNLQYIYIYLFINLWLIWLNILFFEMIKNDFNENRFMKKNFKFVKFANVFNYKNWNKNMKRVFQIANV